MKKVVKKIHKILMLGGIAVLGATACLLATPPQLIPLQAEGNIKECALEETYRIGTEIQPENAVLTYQGKEYTSNGFSVSYPNKIAKSGKDNYLLSEVGEYEVAYTYDSDKLQLRAVKKFTVLDSVYSFTTQSGLEYTSVSEGKAEGLKLTFDSGDVFTYNQPIDLTANAKLATVNILQDCKSPIASTVRFTVADAYNPEKFIDIVIFYSGQYQHIYGRAGANHQEEKACIACADDYVLSGVGRQDFYLDGQRYYTRVNTTGIELGSKNTFSLYYDNATGDIHIQNEKGKVFVTNVCNPSIYSEPFEGFTTGEAILSVAIEDFTSGMLALEITELAGVTGSALQERLYADMLAPNIQVNVPEMDGITIAKGKPVNVFESKTYDVNLIGDTRVACYYNYGTDHQTQVLIVDGAFTPAFEGLYTLVYTAQDSYGMVGTETVAMRSIDADGLFTTEKSSAELFAGKNNELGYTFTGLNGDVFAQITATNGKETVDIKDGIFRPLYSGEYTITVTLTDGIFTETQTGNVEVKPSENQAFIDEIVLPNYFVMGETYSLPNVRAYEFSQGAPKAVETVCYVMEDGKEKRAVEADTYTVLATNEVIVRFESKADSSVFVESAPVKVVSLDNGNAGKEVKNLFVGDFTSTYEDGGVHYVTNAQSGDTTLMYVNPISLSNFHFVFKVAENESGFDTMRIRLTDYADRSVYTDILLTKQQSKVFIQIDDGISTFFGKNFTELDKITFNYNDANGSLYYTFTDYVTIKTPFTGDRVFVDVSFLNVQGATAVYVYELNNQMLVDLGGDYVGPSISVQESSGIWEKGDKAIIYVPEVSDEMSSVLKKDILVTVTGPDKMALQTLDGKTLRNYNITENIEIELTQFGAYTVRYTVSDNASNGNEHSYQIIVGDVTAPIVTLEQGYQNGCIKIGALGAKVPLASITVSDDISEKANISKGTYVYRPDGGRVELDGNILELTIRGKYTVCYLVMDEAGNSAFVSYTIICE